jgi:muramoyltetrapeptide carboxypeptidase
MDFFRKKNKKEKNKILIDIIAPSSSLAKEEFLAIKKLLKSKNLEFNFFEEKDSLITKINENEFPEISPEIRFSQIKKSLENQNSQIIWCAKGGYGCAEILPFFENQINPLFKEKLIIDKKIFIGFSDISSLNKILIEDLKMPVLVAPMLNQIAQKRVSEKSIKVIFDLILGKISELKYDVKSLNNLTQETVISGILCGGCLSVLCGNFATKNQINWKNKILFLEDEGEDGERLDRYFYQIYSIISEGKKYPKAILLGNFLHINPHGNPKEKNIKIAIEKFVKNLQKLNVQIPIYQEQKNILGHSKNMMPIILGKKAEINGNFLIQKI